MSESRLYSPLFTPCILDDAPNFKFIERQNVNVMKTKSRLFIPSGASETVVSITANAYMHTNIVACRTNNNDKAYCRVLDKVNLLYKNKVHDTSR